MASLKFVPSTSSTLPLFPSRSSVNGAPWRFVRRRLESAAALRSNRNNCTGEHFFDSKPYAYCLIASSIGGVMERWCKWTGFQLEHVCSRLIACYVGPMTAVPGMLCFFLIADDKVACSEKNAYLKTVHFFHWNWTWKECDICLVLTAWSLVFLALQ